MLLEPKKTRSAQTSRTRYSGTGTSTSSARAEVEATRYFQPSPDLKASRPQPRNSFATVTESCLRPLYNFPLHDNVLHGLTQVPALPNNEAKYKVSKLMIPTNYVDR